MIDTQDIYDDYYKAVKENLELKDENLELKRKLEVAKKALECCALGETQFDGVEAMHEARKALKEIGDR